MPKQLDFTLNEEELKHIQVAMKSLDSRVAKRATIIHGLHLGHRPDELADLHGISQVSVYNYFNQFKSEGVSGLPDKPKSGRPRKATPAYISLLEETIARDPKELGFAFTVWTQPRLRAYLNEQTNIHLSRSRFHDLMQKLGYVYRRPKYDVSYKQDPQMREQAIEALDELKKEPKQGISSYSLWTKA